jgi:hypothetical protein
MAACFLLPAAAGPVAAQDREFGLAFSKDRQLVPPELTLPAHVRVKLTIKNEGSTASEFECPTLNREKVVPAGGEGIVYVGPLSPGSHECFDDFHPETRGRLIVK